MTRGPEVRDNLGALPLPHKFTLLSSFNRPPDPHMPYGAKNSAALPATNLHTCALAHLHTCFPFELHCISAQFLNFEISINVAQIKLHTAQYTGKDAQQTRVMICVMFSSTALIRYSSAPYTSQIAWTALHCWEMLCAIFHCFVLYFVALHGSTSFCTQETGWAPLHSLAPSARL